MGRRPSPLAVAAALLVVVSTVPLFLAWAFTADGRWGWVAVVAPVVAAGYGWRRGGDADARPRDRLLPMLAWAWLAAAVTSSAVLALA